MTLPTSSKAQQRPEKQSFETLGITLFMPQHAARKERAYELAASRTALAGNFY